MYINTDIFQEKNRFIEKIYFAILIKKKCKKFYCIDLLQLRPSNNDIFLDHKFKSLDLNPIYLFLL